jgi:hypothetical protein
MSLRAFTVRVAAVFATSVTLATGVTSASAATSPTLSTGFFDQAVLTSDAPGVWLDRAQSVGASRMRVGISWLDVAPVAPGPSEATDPGWPGFRFAPIDAQVRAVAAKGMVPFISVTGVPGWAEEPGRPREIRAGAWKPDVAAFGSFMRAVAARYSGSFPDPENPGTTLPRVQAFQLWNEPNLDLYLAPQYEDGKPYAPVRWRQLLNAGYAAVKAVQPGANVIAAGLAPFGDPVSRNAARTRPVAFLRSALCLDERLDRACTGKTTADTFSLHPYAVDRPGRHALDQDDATIPDYNRIATVLNAAWRLGTVGPKQPKSWVTEVSYDSSPPDPDGVPLATRARYISETMWRLWRVGVSTVIWYLMRDDPSTPSYASTYQSGIFYRDGRRKADARAFRFPLLVTGRSATRLNVWFRTPIGGTVTVQIRRRGRWTSVAKVRRVAVDGVASLKVPRSGVTGVRGIAGKATSYVWNVG